MDPAALRRLIDEALPDITTIRRDLHAHPELAYQERRTSGVVCRELARLGVAHKPGMAGGTGVLAHLPATGAARPGAKSLALRADMDALPITEETGASYASTSPGLMHACGHDGHTSILLGVARVLSRLPERPRPITLVFQPAEEGGAGGKRMCDEGSLAGEGAGGLGPPVERIYGLHGWPQLPVGALASRPGPMLAATDSIDVTIRGEQSHAAYPHFSRDPIVAAAQCITALQTVASRNIGPLQSVVVTVGVLSAGSARNVIPQTATFSGTIRTLTPDVREMARRRVREIVEGVSSAMGCRAEVKLEEGYPATRNDPGATARFFEVARGAFGAERVTELPEPSMGGEDFSYYGLRVPACFFLLGVRPAGRDTYPSLHQPTYDFNDEALAPGVEAMCRLALHG